MARHPVGPFSVDVLLCLVSRRRDLHQRDNADQKPDVILIVFRDGQFVEMARFGWHEFNSAALRRRLKSLNRFSVQRLAKVIEDARCWPKDEAKTPMKPNPRRVTRP